MKQILYILTTGLLLLFFLPQPVSAQEEDDSVFTAVEEHPQFPGGEKARKRYLQENITYPKSARKEGAQGTVYITFIIEKDGSITNVEILRGIHDDIDQEAIRVVKAMPKWIPGTQRGEPVRVQFNMPIRFLLDDDSKPKKKKKEKSASDKKSIL